MSPALIPFSGFCLLPGQRLKFSPRPIVFCDASLLVPPAPVLSSSVPPPHSAPSPPGPLHIFYWEILHLHVHPSSSFRTALSQHFRREAPPRTHSGLGYLVGHMFSGPTVPVEPVPCCVTPWSLQLLPSFCLCHQLRVSLRNVFAHSGPSRV